MTWCVPTGHHHKTIWELFCFISMWNLTSTLIFFVFSQESLNEQKVRGVLKNMNVDIRIFSLTLYYSYSLYASLHLYLNFNFSLIISNSFIHSLCHVIWTFKIIVAVLFPCLALIKYFYSFIIFFSFLIVE